MTPNLKANRTDIISLGEIVMDMFPKEQGAQSGTPEDFIPQPGGANANVAVAAARLGARSAFIGKVGSDIYGELLTQVLKTNGVEMRGLRVDPVHLTTQVFLSPSEESPKPYNFNRVSGADLFCGVDDLDLDLIRYTEILHITSLFLVSEPSRSAQWEAIKVAKDSGVLISFDVNHRPGLWPDKNEALSQIRSVVSFCDILKVNEVELELLTGSRDPVQGVPLILAEGVDLVAVTLGERGSYFATMEHHGFIPAINLIEVDPLGCGDAFTAGILVEISKERKSIPNFSLDDLERIFRFSNAVGALASTSKGAISSFPERSLVEELISRT